MAFELVQSKTEKFHRDALVGVNIQCYRGKNKNPYPQISLRIGGALCAQLGIEDGLRANAFIGRGDDFGKVGLMENANGGSKYHKPEKKGAKAATITIGRLFKRSTPEIGATSVKYAIGPDNALIITLPESLRAFVKPPQ